MKKTTTLGRRSELFNRGADAGLTLAAVGIMLFATVFPVLGNVLEAAHPEAVLESERASANAGGAIALRGSQFGENGTYALQLLGALNEYDLGAAKSDGDGRFALDIAIPGDVRPGAYQVVAIASDGDVIARLDVTLAAALPMAAEEHSEMDATSMDNMEEHQARADEISIARDRNGVEWGAIGLIIGAAGGLGIGLGRRQKAL